MLLDIDSIKVVGNVRSNVNDIDGLASSIQRLGQITPISVVSDDNGEWVLIAGHRRLEAMRQAGFTQIEATENAVVDSAADRMATQYAENHFRKGLSAYDEAQVALDLKAEGLNQKAVATELGVSQKQVARMQKAAKQINALPNAEEAHQLTADALFELADLSGEVKLDEPELVVENVLRSIVAGEARSIDQAFGNAEREAERAAKTEILGSRLEALTAEGVTVVDQRPVRATQIADHHQGNIQAVGQLPPDTDWVKDHRSLDCHVVWIQDSYYGPALTEWCLKPNVHKAAGKSELKEASADENAARAAKEKQERREAKEAKNVRLNNVEAFVKAGWSQADILKRAPEALPLSADERRVMCRALQIERIDSPYGNYPDYQAMLDGYLAKLPDKKRQLFPIVAAMAYGYIEATYAGIKYEEVFE